MAKKQQQPTPKKERKPECLSIDNRYLREGELEKLRGANEEQIAAFNEELTARALTEPEVRAASIIQQYEGEKLDINCEVNELRRLVGKVHDGNMETMEAMLVSQAHALDALFCYLARRSHTNMVGGYGEAADRYLRLAMKAQTQCRATIETLGTLKNPTVVIDNRPIVLGIRCRQPDV